MKPLIRPVIAGAPSVHTDIRFPQHSLFSSNVAVIECICLIQLTSQVIPYMIRTVQQQNLRLKILRSSVVDIFGLYLSTHPVEVKMAAVCFSETGCT
jgi:hypothetical protein